MMIPPRIAIVGAGPGALTLGRLLQTHSIPFKIFEKEKDRFARSQGGSLDLHEGSAQRALREAGVYEQFLAHARPEGETLRILDPQSQVLLDESREGGGSRPEQEFKGRPEIDRVVLRNLLLDSLNDGSVVWSRKLLEVDKASDNTFNLQFENGVEGEFDLVVGAEGAWSRVRPSVTDAKPFYSGVGGLDLKFTDIEKNNPTVAERMGKGMCLTLGPNRGLLAQRNGDGSARVYAFVKTAEEQYNMFDPRTSTDPKGVKKDMVAKFYNDWDEASQNLVFQSDDEIFVRPMYMLPIGLTWSHKPGITLLGDAAHLMAPFAGVGVNVAMEDALELSQEIVSTKSAWTSRAATSAAIAEALQKYETSMWARAKENAEATWKYLNLFFHERGGHAMIEHFEEAKKQEAQQSS